MPENVARKAAIMYANNKIMFVINGQQITWAMFGWVLRQLRGNISTHGEQAARIFYRAKVKNAKNVMSWIREGLLKKPQYALLSCRDETEKPKAVREWIDSEALKIQPTKMNVAVKEALHEIADKL